MLPIFIVGLFSSQTFAAAGDVISNTATIDFIYQGNSLIQESSPTGNIVTGIGNGIPTSFVEDRLINFSVVSTDATEVAVASLQSQAVLEFTVTNNGNALQDFLLTAVNTSPSPFVANPDNFDPVSPMQVFVEQGSNAGYLLAEDTEVFIDELAVGATATVYVVASIPATSVGDAAAVALVAQVAEGGSVGQGAVITKDDNGHISPAGLYSNGSVDVPVAGTPNTVTNTAGFETVFNDPAAVNVENVDSAGVQDIKSNGQHSDTGLFLVQSVVAPVVTLIKTVTVIDTLGGTDPHAGATLRYQIDVVVGLSNVSNLVITDPIPANTSYVVSSLQLNGAPQTEANDPLTDYSEFNGSNIVVDLSQGGTVSVAPGTPNQITFDVTID